MVPNIYDRNPVFHRKLIHRRVYVISFTSILKSPTPLSGSGRNRKWLTAIVFAAIGIALGLWQAQSISKIAFGYVADYNYVIAFLTAALFSAIGLPLLIYWRTRWVGIGLISTGVLSLVCFLGGLGILLKLDRVAWRHEPPFRSFGPAQKASAVIYFCSGIRDQQIEDFRESVLEVPQASRANRSFPAYVSSYFRLMPSQANGYQGIALNFNKNAAPDQIKDYMARIDSDRRVMDVFIDAVPNLVDRDRDADGRCR